MKTLRPYAAILCGDLLLAVGVAVFLAPRQLVTGGVSGLAIVIGDYSARAGYAIPIWLTNLALNIPLFWVGLRTMGKPFLWRTAFATGFLSVALYLAAFIPPLPGDVLLAALFGGALSGLGAGVVFKAMATTGGSDLAAGILHRHVFRHVSVAKILFVIDSLIIVSGLLAFGPVSAMYAVISVFVASKVTDALLEGLSFAKAAFIITEQAERIAQGVIKRLDRSATRFSGQGMFSKQPKDMLLCVVSSKELVTLKAMVQEIDEHAFVIVADVREVLGEGFKNGEQMFSMQM